MPNDANTREEDKRKDDCFDRIDVTKVNNSAYACTYRATDLDNQKQKRTTGRHDIPQAWLGEARCYPLGLASNASPSIAVGRRDCRQ